MLIGPAKTPKKRASVPLTRRPAACVSSPLHTHTHTHARTRAPTRACTHAHTHMHAHTRTHTHARPRTRRCNLLLSPAALVDQLRRAAGRGEDGARAAAARALWQLACAPDFQTEVVRIAGGRLQVCPPGPLTRHLRPHRLGPCFRVPLLAPAPQRPQRPLPRACSTTPCACDAL
jgi:hypothetical protein